MSSPRCRCASKMSAPAGSCFVSRSSYSAISARSRSSVSTRLSLCAPQPSGSVPTRRETDPKITPVPDVLIFGETMTHPAMRHEVPVAIGDDFIYLERNGTRMVVVGALETPRLGGNGLDVRAVEQFGYDDLIGSGIGRDEAFVEIA